MAPPQGGAAARQKPPSGPVVPGHVTLAGQRVRLPLCAFGGRPCECLVCALLHTSVMQASVQCDSAACQSCPVPCSALSAELPTAAECRLIRCMWCRAEVLDEAVL